MIDPDCDGVNGGLQSQLKEPKLTNPHSVSMVDFDGDCLSDLFMTVQDEKTGKMFYEIYLRRENKANDLGFSSFCLVAYDDISNINNQHLFEFADIDRDGLIDMIYLTDTQGMNFIVNYNMLKSSNHMKELNKIDKKSKIDFDNIKSQIQVIKNICNPTNRGLEKLSRIYAPYVVDLNTLADGSGSSVTYKDKEAQELEQSRYVFQQIISSDQSATGIF
jgi:hypothetical protein